MRVKISQYEQGQALPLALILLPIVASVLFYMFNTGQVVQEKMRLTNTADAVAYSAGVYEARVLNYDAYTNRAMIANEIAIGHAVGMASWAKYAATSADNISTYVRYIPYIGQVLEQLLQELKEAIEIGLKYFALVAVGPFDEAIQILKASQMATHAAALNGRNQVIDEVAKRNDPDVSVEIISDNFFSFTQHYQGNDRTRMLNAVERNRQQDDFLRSRNWDEDFGLCIKQIGGLEIQFVKRGGTGIIGFDGWKSIDTFSAHVETGRKCKSREQPIGYGSSYSIDGLGNNYVAYQQSSAANPYATSYANGSAGQAWDEEPPSITGGEIPSHWGLSQQALNQDDPRTQLTIRASKSADKQRYSGGQGAVKPAGSLALYNGAHADAESASIARAEVFFERPDGANPLYKKAEKGSLFNPYWQVHLVPVTVADKNKALQMQGFN